MHFVNIKTTKCDSACRNHTPPVQASEIVALFVDSRALQIFRVHRSLSWALCPLASELCPWNTEMGVEMGAAENTPSASRIHHIGKEDRVSRGCNQPKLSPSKAPETGTQPTQL